MSELRAQVAANFTKTAGVKRLARLAGAAKREARSSGSLSRHSSPGAHLVQRKSEAAEKSFLRKSRGRGHVAGARSRLALQKEVAKTTPDFPMSRWRGLSGEKRIEALKAKGLSR